MTTRAIATILGPWSKPAWEWSQSSENGRADGRELGYLNDIVESLRDGVTLSWDFLLGVIILLV